MSKDNAEIKELLRQICCIVEGLQLMEAEVVSVKSDRTCAVKVIRTGLEIEDVRYQSLVGGTTGIYGKPAAGSKCIIMSVGKVHYAVITGETTQVELNGNQYGGVPISESVVSRLNAIEQDLNSIKTVFKNWIVAANDGGGALKTASATWANQQLTETAVEDIHNENVKHG